MLRSFGLELTSLVNSDPAWKVPKGSRSASRRARKTVCESLKNCTGLINRSSSNMPVSGSEKRGASMFDCRFSEKAEHVPIKKRRFLLRPSPPPPPSPPPVISSEPAEETANLTKSDDTSHKLAAVESASSDFNSSKIIGNSISIHNNNSEKANKGFGEDDDFSGISILAAAACSSSLGRECGYAEDGVGVEESSAQGLAREVSAITEAPSSSRGLLREDFVNSSEMSTGRTSSCVSTEPVGELPSISTTENSPQKVTTGEGSKVVSLKVDSLIKSGDVSCSKDEETVGIQKMGSQDVRLHWDLNVVMDAWEHPFESPKGNNDVPHHVCQDVRENNHDENKERLEGCDLPDKLATIGADHNFVLPGEPRIVANRNLVKNKVNDNTGCCHDVAQPTGTDEKPLLSDCKRNLDAVKCTVEDSKCMCYNTTVKSTDGLVDTALNPGTHPNSSEVMNKYNDVSGHSLKLNGDGHLQGRSTLDSQNLSASGSYCVSENLRRTCALNDMQISLTVSSCPDIHRQVIPNLAVVGNMKTFLESQYNVSAAPGKDAMKTSEPLEHPHVKSDGNSLPLPSACVEVPNSASSRCELAVGLDANVLGVGSSQSGNLVCGTDTIVNVSEISLSSKETCDSVSHDTCNANLNDRYNFSDKIDPAKAVNRDGADAYLHPISSAGNEAMIEHPEDFDSQYEDGEVREPNEHPWEGYDGVDREAEHVDYELDDTEMCTPIDYHISESGYVEDRENRGPGVAAVISSSVCDAHDGVGGESTKPIGDDGAHEQGNKVMLNYASEERMKAPRSKELLERSNSSDMDIALSDDNGGKDRSESHPDTNVESKPFRRGLQSRIEAPAAHDTSSLDERLNKSEFRYEESSSMRSFERTRYSFHNQGRGQRADSWNSFRGNRRGAFRRRYSPIVNRHAKVEDDATMERDNIGYASVQDDGSYSHQLHPRSRSGGDEDEHPGLHSRYRPNRAFSPGRPSTFGRGRSIRYGSFINDRGGRGRYNGPSSDESFRSSLNYRRPLSIRQRSFSPFEGRAHSNAHHSRGKSPSQSRSRSPIMWDSPRGRPGAGSGGSTFVRQRSRSPNFRSEVRIQRLRHQPDFGPDHTGGFRSIARSHGSPPHGRWSSAGKEEMGHFRDFAYKQRPSGLDRSPVRTRLRGDRANVLDSPRNLKPDGYYRTSEDAACRGPRYEENFEGRRKHYGPLRPARRNYEDDLTGRSHQDNDDSFSIAKGIRGRDASDFQGRGPRGMDSRLSDFPRRFRGEQHSFMCERDDKFNSTSKQFGVDEMDSSRNLKSEGQYRSSQGGRFSDVDGLNRGRRYDNFEDRRRHYDPPNHMKRSDTGEGSEKRLNHNLDENFQDDPNFSGRAMRSFDGRASGLSTRLREDKDSAVSIQENKLEGNPQ